MTYDQDQLSRQRDVWLLAVIAGLVFAAVFFVLIGFGAMQALFMGAVVTVLVGLLVGLTVRPSGRSQSVGDTVARAKSRVSTAPLPASASGQVADRTAVPSVDPAAERGKPAEREAKVDASVPDGPAHRDTTQAVPPVAADGKPSLLDAPRDGKADDLKRIGGVGPRMEETLNELGIYHFDQIAAWRDAEIDWVDSRVSFSGRIRRDNWVEQARILAAGGETEFSARKPAP